MQENAQRLYQKYLKEGNSSKDAAKRAQQETGVALRTNAPIQQKKIQFTSKGTKYGQYPVL